MKWFLTLAIAIAVAGWFASQFAKLTRARLDLTEEVERQLALVDDHSIESVKAALVEKAGTLGVTLRPGDIQVEYADTDQQLYPQRVLGKIAQFKNKRVGIAVNYHWRLLGFGINQDIARTTIVQIQVRQKELPPEYQELLN